MRFGRAACPVINDRPDYKFEIGKGTVVREGTDVTIVVTGCVGGWVGLCVVGFVVVVCVIVVVVVCFVVSFGGITDTGLYDPVVPVGTVSQCVTIGVCCGIVDVAVIVSLGFVGFVNVTVVVCGVSTVVVVCFFVVVSSTIDDCCG